MKYLIIIKSCVVGLLLSGICAAQTTIINGATIHVGNGKVIENGVLVIEKDRLLEVGTSLKNLYKNEIISV